LGPIGIIVGPFLGAFFCELLISRRTSESALKAAFGAFVGFLFGVGFKLVTAIFIMIYFFIILFG
jgi:uncharacterized protein YqgC (DUF456 family)